MKNDLTLIPRSLAALVAALLVGTLGACGGGGAATPVPPSASSTPSPAGSQTVSIVTTAPAASSYTGEELTVYNTFNTARAACGFGYLRQNANLDAASFNHVKWMALNNTGSHEEVAGTPNFSGIEPGDRISVAGYANSLQSDEVLARSNIGKTGFGTWAATALLSAPYHMLGIFHGNRELGISLKSSSGIGSGADIEGAGLAPMSQVVVEMAASKALLPQQQAAADVLTYPCQGVTGTAYQLQNESPNPVPGRNLFTNPIGQPIYIQVVTGHTLSISTVTVTGPGGPVVLLPTMTSANDSNSFLSANQAVVMPNGPLLPTTNYSVAIAGSNSGQAFTRNFTFTTGP